MRRVLAVLVTALMVGCGSNGGSDIPDGGSRCLGGIEYAPPQTGGWAPVCMYEPTLEVVRTPCGEVTERCDTAGVTAPNLSCVTTPVTDEPTVPETVTLTGYLMVFSGGPDSKNITVKIYDATKISAPEDIDTVAPLGTTTTALPESGTPADGEARACPTEQENKDRHIGCVPPLSGACSPPCQDAVTGSEFCHVPAGEVVGECIERSRYEPRYTVPGIPTRTPLLVVTSGPGGKDDPLWSLMVQQNEYISTNAPECDDTLITNCFHDKAGATPHFELDLNALSRGDYHTIPTVAGISGGIPDGHGGLAGEIRDCDDVRVQNVQVGADPAPGVLTYFNGNQWDTLPIRLKTDGTCRLGLYAAMDVAPGWMQVQAVGLVNGEQVSFGWYEALVFPDAITIASINTGKPLPSAPR